MALVKWENAPDVSVQIKRILKSGVFEHVKFSSLHVFRGIGSSSRAIARIWSLPTPWQKALEIKPQYIIEVIAQRFDRLSKEDQERTLIHELMHIPKTFSGALVSHRGRYHRIDRRSVESVYEKFKSSKDS